MRKWNTTGFLVFLLAWLFTEGIFLLDGLQGLNFVPLFLFTLAGITLIGLDRWVGGTVYGVFPVAFLWAAYWGLAALGLFSIATLFAFSLGFGPGNTDQQWIAEALMIGHLCTAILFAVLGLVNLIKFFIALFSLAKSKTH